MVQMLACHHDLDQCWIVVTWAAGSKFQGNLNQNTIPTNEFDHVVCENMAAICPGLHVFISTGVDFTKRYYLVYLKT